MRFENEKNIIFFDCFCACGEADWRETLQEYENFVNDYVNTLQEFTKNPTDTILKEKIEALQNDVSEWDAKMKKISEDLKGTAEEKEFQTKQMELYSKLMQVVVDMSK